MFSLKKSTVNCGKNKKSAPKGGLRSYILDY